MFFENNASESAYHMTLLRIRAEKIMHYHKKRLDVYPDEKHVIRLSQWPSLRIGRATPPGAVAPHDVEI
ncbi:hypothetical protein ASL71_00495 [Salmonella enterica subsp. enterica serovar Isangi]|uniref:Uncharacterized protein n=1 Tax=Salmonella enterica subsp. enterica serovar Isangi TaxID=1386015 RepID=A0A601KDJ7_SALET|nr:hypothetical protein CHD05_10250 [Salmonella enterica]EAA5944482.1 hypothetical protein [Salmonella enterica subsp. enterica serovar Isangi]ECC3619560.1 hypothetical protein [Salmonella enterica subsp. enterica]ECI3889680.1 hypothetical protein [Salmonella enterica subsp. enterica serovar Gombe]EAB7144537.1 hypothetical protein [Salmonella enterica subsp. enterica serovar Isangi]